MSCVACIVVTVVWRVWEPGAPLQIPAAQGVMEQMPANGEAGEVLEARTELADGWRT